MFVQSHHQVTVTGRVIKEVELHYTQAGIPIIKLNIPTNNVFRDENGNTQTETTWLNITLLNKTAEIAQDKIRKGDYIHVLGRLKPQIRCYFDEKSGQYQASYEMIAEDTIFLPYKNGNKSE
jgi:single-strand DNA-binding protein